MSQTTSTGPGPDMPPVADEPPDEPVDGNGRWMRRADTKAVRALTGGATALLVAFLVAGYSQIALGARTGNEGTTLGVGTVELADDDEGRTLFDVPNMAPGRPVTQCINVHYVGTVTPASISLTLEGGGDLADDLDLTVEVGDGGGYQTCRGFVSDGVVHQGTFGALLRDEAAVLAWRASSSTRQRTFRFTFVMDEDATPGSTARASFVWRANP